jgi:hypothetical protein
MLQGEANRQIWARERLTDATLNGSSVGDGLIRVDALVGLLAVEEVLEELLHLGNTGGATDKNKLVNLVLLQRGVIENALDRAEGLLEEIHAELLELGTGDGLGEISTVEEGLNLDTLLMAVGKSTLGALDLPAELLNSLLVLGSVLAALLLEELEHVVHDAPVEVLTSKMCVSVGGDNLEHTVVDGEHGHIEGSTTQIENKNVLLSSLVVKAVSDGSSGGLVDDTEHIEARDGAGILGGLALGVIKVGGHSDHSVEDGLSKESLGSLLQRAEIQVSDALLMHTHGVKQAFEKRARAYLSMW